jgi:hypothetical protein
MIMEDIGLKFGRDKTFCFDAFIIDEIIFDDTDDITLYCRVPYYGDEYTATFGLTFEQLNIILRSIRSAAEPIATALAEKLNGPIEIPSVIQIASLYSIPLEVTSVILYTTLYELIEDDDEEEDDEGYEGEDDEYEGAEEDMDLPEEDEDMVAFAFLVEDILVLPPTS